MCRSVSRSWKRLYCWHEGTLVDVMCKLRCGPCVSMATPFEKFLGAMQRIERRFDVEPGIGWQIELIASQRRRHDPRLFESRLGKQHARLADDSIQGRIAGVWRSLAPE